MNDLLDEAALMAWSGYNRRLDLIKWLRDSGIQFFHGKGGAVCTTTAAINHRLTGGPRPVRPAADDEIRFKA